MRYNLFVLLVLFGACSSPVKESREARVVKELMDKEMIFTDNMFAEVPNGDKLSQDVFQLKIPKIVAIVNYDCGPCRESIKKWKEYLSNKDITFILIVRGGDEEFYHEIQSKESSSFRYIYYDMGNVFELTNKIPQETRLRTFLINGENKIRIIGNPLFNKAIAKLYDEETTSASAIKH